MRRLNPFGSLFGFILTFILILILGVSLWINRGLAFSPGKVTSISKQGTIIQGFKSHADFEKRCVYCHAPLETDLAGKCEECHTDIKQQIEIGDGVHSQIASVNECASCHPEHLGREFNPTFAAFQIFDHSKTSFSLNWHQENYDTTPMKCDSCHASNDFSSVSEQICLDCHANHDQKFAQAHPKDFGSNCLGCHDGADRMRAFDHGQTGFPLEAKHGQIRCTACHTSSKMNETPKDCISCHPEPAVHVDLFEPTCGSCHSAEGWSPANYKNQQFTHLKSTGFSLKLHQVDYSQQIITCATCHVINMDRMDFQTCVDCHASHDSKFMADHLQQYGKDCAVCHDGVDRLSNFDHANFFALDGKHASIQCLDCHKGQVFRGTPANCWECHQEPDIHAGVFGLGCDSCHDTSAWSPASLKKHLFPLNHGYIDQTKQSDCNVCHSSNYIEYTCYNCHDHQQAEILQTHLDKGITEQEFPACAKCHPDGVVVKGIIDRDRLRWGIR